MQSINGIPTLSADIMVPTDAAQYILFQRTNYQILSNSLLVRAMRKLLPNWPIYNFSVLLEAKLRKKKVCQHFSRDMFTEYRTIRPWLPSQATSILDIGCGIGGINIHLYRHYQESEPNLYLLDKTELANNIYYSFRDRTTFYNSLAITKNMLTANHVPKKKIHLLEATSDYQIKISGKLDLVISLISWGYHYPISTYLNRVYELLQEGGHLIVDVRNNTGQVEEIEAKFGNVRVIFDGPKQVRVLSIK